MSSFQTALRESGIVALTDPEHPCKLNVGFGVCKRQTKKALHLLNEYADKGELDIKVKHINGLRTTRFEVKVEGSAKILHTFLLDLNVLAAD